MSLSLPGVSLVCVDCRRPHDAAVALRHSMSLVSPRDAWLFTDADGIDGPFRVVPIPTLSSVQEYDRWLVHDLPGRRDTFAGHVLNVQADGFVLNPAAWTDEFLGYDFVGAPADNCAMPPVPPNAAGVVKFMNSGFCLFSQQMLGLFERLRDRFAFPSPLDSRLSFDYRGLLTDHGARYPTAALARRFAIENHPYEGSFGFHSKRFMELNGISLEDPGGLAALVRPFTAPAPLIFLLGMHRSGTSCLASCLEGCGAALGPVDRGPTRWQPRGLHENRGVMGLNDRILTTNGGSWDRPIDCVRATEGERHSIYNVVHSLRRRAGGSALVVKDPRLLWTYRHWSAAYPLACAVGTFRHPRAVAYSLHVRDGMSPEQAYALWRSANQLLSERLGDGPLVEFTPEDWPRYIEAVCRVAGRLGLPPEREKVTSRVVTEGGTARRVPDWFPQPSAETRTLYDELCGIAAE